MTRYRTELAIAAVLGALSVVTALWPTWLESLIGVSPDGGAGSAEWWLVGGLAVSAAAVAALARRELRTQRGVLAP